MKMGKMVTVAIAAALAGVAFAEDLVLTGAYPVTVASGSTTTLSDKITGTGPLVVLGGGTVALSNSGNDFTGGIIVSNGIVRADAAGSLGTGPISLESDAALRQVRFNANNATFGNSITLKDNTTSANNPGILALKSVTLAGTIAIDPDTPGIADCYLFIQSGESGNTTPKITMNGDIISKEGRVQLYSYGNMRINGRIDVKRMFFGGGFGVNGTIQLANPSNAIYTAQLYAADVSCLDTNVLRNCLLEFAFNAQWGANGHGFLSLNGHDQVFSALRSKDNNLSLTAYACGISTSATLPATITVNGYGITGNSYNYMQCRLAGPISLVIDGKIEDGRLYQGINHRAHMGTGTVEVCNGTFRCIKGATLQGITNVIVRSGAAVDLNAVTNVFSALKNIVIEGTGRFFSDTGCLTPVNCPNTDLIMDEESFFQVRTGVTNTVDHLIIGGKEIPSGTYTYNTLPQMRYASNPSYFGGALIVRRHHRGLVMKFR